MSPDGQRILEHLADVERLRAERTSSPALARAVQLVKQFQSTRFSRTYADLLADSRYAQDSRMGRHCLAANPGRPAMSAGDYIEAWRATGEREGRALQIDLTMQIGRALDHYTRNAILRGALHMMRRPARAAGLGELQHFLESGFDTFGRMRGAQDFLDIVRHPQLSLGQVGPRSAAGRFGLWSRRAGPGAVRRRLAHVAQSMLRSKRGPTLAESLPPWRGARS